MIRKALVMAGVVAAALMGVAVPPAMAVDLGVEGQVYEPMEEDFRVMLMRLMARQDWVAAARNMEQSARDYTKNLPQYALPRATKTQTLWKDVGIVVEEDVYLPWVDWETGSVFDPEDVLAVPAGTYLNPITHLPAAAIERLFIFDATDPEQLAFAESLMKANIEQLSFMAVAGDVGEISERMMRPVYHPSADMFKMFQIKAVPLLIGFGKGPHHGHMATTEIALPADVQTVKDAWFGLPYPGYDPSRLYEDVFPAK